MYVFIVDLPPSVGQPCRQEPMLVHFESVYECTGSSGAPSLANAGSTVCTLFRQSVRSRTPSRCSTRS